MSALSLVNRAADLISKYLRLNYANHCLEPNYETINA